METPLFIRFQSGIRRWVYDREIKSWRIKYNSCHVVPRNRGSFSNVGLFDINSCQDIGWAEAPGRPTNPPLILGSCDVKKILSMYIPCILSK